MFTHTQETQRYSTHNNALWSLMAFQAGAINVGGFLACHNFVSHVTGFATNFAANLAHGESLTALGLLLVPGFFLLGSMLAGLLVDTRKQKGKTPLYPYVFGILTLLLGIVTWGGVINAFGEFGISNIFTDFALMAILSFSSGLQNATVTSAFNSVVRTTHLTGLTTDLGIGLARILTRSHKINTRANEIAANTMRITIMASFIAGSTVAGFIFFQSKYWGFLIPTSIALLLWAWSLKEFSLKKWTKYD